jgi:NADH-quinone oxidoreductase subunit L
VNATVADASAIGSVTLYWAIGTGAFSTRSMTLSGGSYTAAIIMAAGIGYLGRRSDGPALERFLGPLQTVFANKFYFDQIYAALIVRPLEGLALVAALFDRYVIDGAVDAIAWVPTALGGIVRRAQSGLLQRYALAGVVGVLAIVVLLAWQIRN